MQGASEVLPAAAKAGPGAQGSRDVLPFLAIMAAVLLWGGSFVAMRVAVAALPPMTVMWLRMVIALVVIAPLMPRLARARYHKGDWRMLLPMVLLQPCLYFLLESNALTLTTSSQAGVVSASVPLMVALGAWLFLGERVGRSAVLGLLLSMAGVAVLSLGGGDDGQATAPLLGNLMELGAMACAAGNLLLVKRLCVRYGPWSLTALQVVAGSLFFLPGAWGLWQDPTPLLESRLLFSILFLGSFVTLGAFGLYNWGMSRVAASRAAVGINMVPVVAVLLGWMLLGESLTPVQLGGAGAVLLGVWWSQRR